MSISELPIIDLSPLRSSNPTDYKKVGVELCEAASTVGFFYIKNHGISQIEIKEIFDISERFLHLRNTKKVRFRSLLFTVAGYTSVLQKCMAIKNQTTKKALYGA